MVKDACTYPLENVYIARENHLFDGETHYFLENSLFLWPCSVAMLNYQRVASLQTQRFAIEKLLTDLFHAVCVCDSFLESPTVTQTCIHVATAQYVSLL